MPDIVRDEQASEMLRDWMAGDALAGRALEDWLLDHPLPEPSGIGILSGRKTVPRFVWQALSVMFGQDEGWRLLGRLWAIWKDHDLSRVSDSAHKLLYLAERGRAACAGMDHAHRHNLRLWLKNTDILPPAGGLLYFTARKLHLGVFLARFPETQYDVPPCYLAGLIDRPCLGAPAVYRVEEHS